MAELNALKLAKHYYSLIKEQTLSRHLKEQVLRSSSSIALNLAEGNTKISRKDRHYLQSLRAEKKVEFDPKAYILMAVKKKILGEKAPTPLQYVYEMGKEPVRAV